MSKKIKICLDAGHYGKYNQSPAVPAYYESEMNWKLQARLKAELEAYGMEVITTRKTLAEDMPLTDRGKVSKGCDLFLSLHSNSVGSTRNEGVDYPLVIVQLDGKGDALGKKLAAAVEQTMQTQQTAQVWNKRGNNGEYYGVLRGAAAVGTMGMIVEHSFHTNTNATKWLMSDANLAKLARAEAKVIAEYFGVGEAATTTTVPKPYNLENIPQLYKGVKGDQVKPVQVLLKNKGYYTGEIDGSFGGGTDRAVRAYQEDMGLEADGYVGKATMTALLGL